MTLSCYWASSSHKYPNICGFLKEVGLVSVHVEGQQHFYQIKADGLKPVHAWVTPFEQLWNERFDRLDAYLKALQAVQTEPE